MVQSPGDGHRAFAPVGEVCGGSEKGVWGGLTAGVQAALAYKEKDVAAVLGVILVSAAGYRIRAGVALRLPVKEGR